MENESNIADETAEEVASETEVHAEEVAESNEARVEPDEVTQGAEEQSAEVAQGEVEAPPVVGNENPQTALIGEGGASITEDPDEDESDEDEPAEDDSDLDVVHRVSETVRDRVDGQIFSLLGDEKRSPEGRAAAVVDCLIRAFVEEVGGVGYARATSEAFQSLEIHQRRNMFARMKSVMDPKRDRDVRLEELVRTISEGMQDAA